MASSTGDRPDERRPIHRTWVFWIALISLVLAIAAGYAQQPPNDAVLLDPTGDDCPGYKELTSTLTTTVSATDQLLTATELHVTLTGVTPPNPVIDDNLGQPDVPNDFATCFIPHSAVIKTATWSDGVIDAVFELTTYDETVSLQLSPDHSSVTVDPCKPHGPTSNLLMCDNFATNTIVVRVQKPVSAVLTVPFPSKTETGDGYVQSTWQFAGSMPPLKVDLKVPFDVMATTWVDSPNGRSFGVPFTDSAITVDVEYVLSALAFWVAVAVTSWYLRRTEPHLRRWSRINYRVLLIGVAGILLAFEVTGLGNLASSIALGFVNVLVWTILAAAVAPRSWWVPLVVAALAAWGVLAYLVETRTSQLTHEVLLLLYCALLLGLVGAGTLALWRQIMTTFALTHVNNVTTSWQRLYGTVVQCLVAAALMVVVGFPVGTVLNRGGYRDDFAESLALNLTWSTGVLFRAALAWTTILVLVSFLAAYLLGRMSPGTGSKISVVLAVMLSLAAPWTDRISVTAVLAVPVWLLQAGILWIAFNRLAGPHITVTANKVRRAHDARLLGDATHQWQDPDPAAAAKAAVSAPPRPPEAVRRAQQRILVRGPRRRRLENARAAAAVASVLAIVPVAYLMWTTLGSLGDKLTDNTGMLIVALFAVLELVRWVASGFIFGYFYSDLPGRIGPVKALAFACIYFASCTAPLLVAQALGHDVLHEAIYRGAQFALFIIVLAVVYDLWSVRTRGGDWQDLQRVYDLQNYGRVTAAVAPAALLVITLAHQISTGSGFDLANSLVSGISNVLKMGPL